MSQSYLSQYSNPYDYNSVTTTLLKDAGILPKQSFLAFDNNTDNQFVIPNYAVDTNTQSTPVVNNSNSELVNFLQSSNKPIEINGQNDLLKAEANYYNTLNKSLSDYQNSWQYKYLKPASELVSTASSLGNIFLGMKQYNLAKEQLGLAREKWDLTKQELSRIKNLRNKLTTQYMGK